MFFGRGYISGGGVTAGNPDLGSGSGNGFSTDSGCKLLCAARRGKFIWTCARYQTFSQSPNEEQVSVRCSYGSSDVVGSYDFLANSDVDRITPICNDITIPAPFITSALFIDHRSASGMESARKGIQDIALILGTSTGHVRILSFNAAVDMDASNSSARSIEVFPKSSFSHVYHPVSVESLCTARDMSVFTQLFVLHGDSCVTQLELDVSDGISSYSKYSLPRAKCWQVPFCAKAIVPIPSKPIFPVVVTQGPETAVSEKVDFLVGGKTPVLAMVSSTSNSSGAEKAPSVSLSLGKAFMSVAGWLLSSGQSQQQQQQNSQQQQQQQGDDGKESVKHLSVLTELNDPPREILSFSPSPSYQYVAAADTLGRVSIVDMAEACLVVRIFKGYRNAQCAWLSKKSLPKSCGDNTGESNTDDGDDGDDGDELCKMVLAIYTPVQSIVDLWDPLGQSPFRRIEIDPKYKIAPLYCGNVADNLIFFDVSNNTVTPLHEFILA